MPTPIFVGHKYRMSYAPTMAFLLEFHTEKSATFTYLEGPSKDKQETVTFTAKEIGGRGSDVWLLYWQEEDRTTVVDIDDFKQMYSYSNITMPDHTFHNLKSSVELIS